MFVRVAVRSVGPFNRKPAVEQRRPQTLDIGRAHLDPCKAAAGITLSRIAGGMVSIRAGDFGPVQFPVDVELRFLVIRVRQLHGEDIFAFQCLLQSSPLQTKKPCFSIRVRGNRDSARRSDRFNYLDERLGCNGVAGTLVRRRKANGAQKRIYVRSRLTASQQRQKMHAAVD